MTNGGRIEALVVGDCPVGCGMDGVVALVAREEALFFYSPCCGVAWPRPPLGRAAFAPNGARLATRADLTRNGDYVLAAEAQPLEVFVALRVGADGEVDGS